MWGVDLEYRYTDKTLMRLLRPAWFMLVILIPGSAFSAQFLQFTVAKQASTADIVANRQAVIRLRSGASLAPQIAERLNSLALAGLRSGQVTAKPIKGGAQLVVADVVLISIDQAMALAAKSTPLGLAQTWARNLQTALSTPYVIIMPSDRLQVPLGEQRVIRFGGTAQAELNFSTQNATVANVQLDPTGKLLLVDGVGVGDTTVSASLADQQMAVTIQVRAWAARIPKSVVAEVTSPPLPWDDLRRTVRNAVLFAMKPAASATVELGEPKQRGEAYDVTVRATGSDCFDVFDVVSVALKSVPTPRSSPAELLISNQPERITEPSMLLREQLFGTAPVRLLWHHVNNVSKPLRFAVRIVNRGDKAASIHVTEAATGPHNDEIFVGHTAMSRFVQLVGRGEGYILNVPAGRMLDLYDVRLAPLGIVSGLARLTPLAGDDLLVEIVAEDAWPTDAYFMQVPERLRNDPPLTPYRFESMKSVELEHDAGGPWTFYHIGKDYSVNLQGQKLYGDYGVRYTIKAKFRNPTDKPMKCEIGLRASGGVARCTFLMDGELLETGLLRGAVEQLLNKFDLQPQRERTVTLVTLPESGSNYPVTLTMRSWQ